MREKAPRHYGMATALAGAALIAYSVFILSAYTSGLNDIMQARDFFLFLVNVVLVKMLFIAVLMASAFGAGGFLFSKWLPGFDSLLEEGLFKTALGLAVISLAVFALGIAGLLYPAAGYAVLAAGLAMGARGIIDYARRTAKAPRTISPTFATVVLAAVAAYFLISGLYASFMPPAGFDILMYHYGAPRMYVEAHRIFPTPDVNGSSYPFGTEMLYTLAMMVESDISANLVNFMFSVGCGMFAYFFARRFVKGASPLLGAAIFFSLPVVFWLMPQAYVEFSQGFFICAAVYAMVASFKEKGSRWMYVSALMFGMAMCIKYTSNLLLPVFLAGVVYKYYFIEKSAPKKAALAAITYSAIAVAVVLPWYLKNTVFYGNPFFPLLVPASQGNGSVGEIGSPWELGMKAGPLDFLTVAWRATMDPRSFLVGETNSLGPYFLMFIPGILLFRRVEKELKYLLLFCLFYLAAWFLSAQNIRYLVPLAPYLSLLAGYPIARLLKDEGRAARAAGTALVVLFAFSALAVNTNREKACSFPSATPQNVDRYYLENAGGYVASYQVWKWINGNLPQDAVIYQLWDDASVYFRQRKTIGFPENFGPTCRGKIHLIQGHNSFGGYLPGEEIIGNLKRMGAGYFLVNANREGHALPEDPYFQAHSRLLINGNGVFLFQIIP
ncbi:MAG: glycosyltransferase family 39 protein [Nitrospirota bacterium]